MPDSREDPRCQPGALITDGARLYEVLAIESWQVRYRDEQTGITHRKEPWAVAHSPFRLIRAAPHCPDTLPEEATDG